MLQEISRGKTWGGKRSFLYCKTGSFFVCFICPSKLLMMLTNDVDFDDVANKLFWSKGLAQRTTSSGTLGKQFCFNHDVLVCTEKNDESLSHTFSKKTNASASLKKHWSCWHGEDILEASDRSSALALSSQEKGEGESKDQRTSFT